MEQSKLEIKEPIIHTDTRPGALPFNGFKPPTSNTTYTPNQFFDVVLPHYPRSVTRIVGYLIRKTLGWCDSDGNPQEEQIEVSYSELERKAGVSHDTIRPALDTAVAGNLIECIREGRKSSANESGQTALYSLRWSPGQYTTRPEEFQGFFEGEGNRTDIPNEFFDRVIPVEPLAVIKVVGSIIRNSIGFQTRHGSRRQQVSLTYRQIQNYTQLASRSELANAVRIGLEKKYILRLVDGVFSHRDDERRAATYALRWSDSPTTPKSAPGDHSENQASTTPKSVPAYPSENQTSTSPESGPAYRSEIRTNIKTKLVNEMGKQQQLPQASSEADEMLMQQGFDAETAAELSRAHSLEEIRTQIHWLPLRGPSRSRLGMLRKAIEGRWPEPQKLQAPEVLPSQGREFARHFFAAFGGNTGEPVAEPSINDTANAEAFVARLLQVCSKQEQVPAWGRALAEAALAQRSPMPSLSLAIRQCGDALLAKITERGRKTRDEAIRNAKAGHYAQYLPLYQQWLVQKDFELRSSQPEAMRGFNERREAERMRLAEGTHSWERSMLAIFDQDTTRLESLRQHFHLPEFWQWDAEFNNQSFKPLP